MLLHRAKLIAHSLAIWRRKPCPETARSSYPTFVSRRSRSSASPVAGAGARGEASGAARRREAPHPGMVWDIA
jgi:hypothetical protein